MSGRQIPIQTRVNKTPTTLFIDAATTVDATLTPHRAGTSELVAMSARLQESHLIQQFGIPFALADGPLLDTTQCSGSWLLANDTPRELCAWSTSGKRRVAWSLSAKLSWREARWSGVALDPMRTSNISATARVAAGRAGRLQTVHCDVVATTVPLKCFSSHGKQVPIVTDAEGTKTTAYVDSTTSIELTVSPDGKTLVNIGDSGLDPPRDITQIDFRQFSTTRGSYEVPPSTTSVDELTVSRFAKSDEDEVTVTLHRYRRATPALGMR